LFLFCLLGLLWGCSSPQNTNKPEGENTEKSDKASEESTEDTPVKSENPTFQLSVYVPVSETLPESAVALVETKLNQILTKNSIGGTSPNPRFAVVPRVNVLSKNITSTAPTMFACTYQVTFYVGDVKSKTLFSSTMLEFKGVGETEAEAFKVGIQSIKNQDSQVLKMIEEGKKKIIDFYNTKCEAVLTEANTLAKQQKYAEAIAQLMLVPEDCKECFEKARKAVEPIYQTQVEQNCGEILAKMKAELGKYQDDKAMDYYTQIPHEAKCFKEAESIIQKHLANLKPEEKKKLDLELEKYRDAQALENRKLGAIQNVANNFIQNFSLVEYAKASKDNWFW
jgi:hypothetical protein